MRSALEAGVRGDGVHQPWMDDMRKEGVKRAWVVIYAGVNDPPKQWTIEEAVYYSAYDREGSEITDPRTVERIRISGLANELNRAALKRAIHSEWLEQNSGLIPVDLLDDEWLPPTSYADAHTHVSKVAANLPRDSNLRYLIQEGGYGDGVHHFWMDNMRQEGVREADVSISIEFKHDGRPSKMKVAAERYYRKYDSQDRIKDARQLERIRDSGLADELERIALRRAAGGVWLDVPRPRPSPFVGGTTVVFLDDGWLPTLRKPLFTTHHPE